MRKILMALTIMFAALTLTGCYERVEPGNVGIIVNRLGDDKGVDQQVKGVGRYWIGWNEDLYTFPTFKQMKTYADSFNFQMSDGTSIGYHIGVAYKVDPTKVATVFQTYRKGVDEITDSDLKQKISDSLIRLASKMTTDKFIDGGKADLLTQVLAAIQAEMQPVGIEVMSLSYSGKPEYPPTVDASINAKVTANQTTLQREQEVKQSTAEANKDIEAARGKAESMKLSADAQAYSTTKQAEAEASSINVRGDALRKNPEVITMLWIDKWSGQLPTVMGSDAKMLMQVPDLPKK